MAAAGRIMGTLGDVSSPHFAVQQPTINDDEIAAHLQRHQAIEQGTERLVFYQLIEHLLHLLPQPLHRNAGRYRA